VDEWRESTKIMGENDAITVYGHACDGSFITAGSGRNFPFFRSSLLAGVIASFQTSSV
jgi:hypothetical protein